MTRLVCLIAPALALASGCASTQCCCDPDPTPMHTFGHDGTVERAGGLFSGRRNFCPQCEWAGTKCAACRARECEECAAARVKERPLCAVCRAKERTECAASKCAACATCAKCGVPIAAMEPVGPSKDKAIARTDDIDQPRATLLPPRPADDRREAERMLKMLETKKVAPTPESAAAPPAKPATAKTTSKSKKPVANQTEEPDEAERGDRPITPYAPLRETPMLRSTR